MLAVPEFERDPYPGQPKVLFIGYSESTHTHAWIDLLEGAAMNVRMFGLPTGRPPDGWRVRTYLTQPCTTDFDPQRRVKLSSWQYPTRWSHRWEEIRRGMFRLRRRVFPRDTDQAPQSAGADAWLASIIKNWQPDIIQTLGLDCASYFYLDVRRRFKLDSIGCWVVQVRGGPDLALHRLLPDHQLLIRGVLSGCDQLIADNQQNYEHCLRLGAPISKLSGLGVVPGTGGIDVAALARRWQGPPSRRQRLVLWPKAYECPQSKCLPVLEAIRLAWDRLKPCSLDLLMVVQQEVRMWLQTLPEEIRAHVRVEEKVPRENVLERMLEARLLLAPSLSDGIPNCLYEAMATGAFPIVSPLETITPLVKQERNTLFARNLYPEEVAQALIRALTDDALVDSAAKRNLELVSQVADRACIRPRVVAYYQKLARRLAVAA